MGNPAGVINPAEFSSVLFGFGFYTLSNIVGGWSPGCQARQDDTPAAAVTVHF